MTYSISLGNLTMSNSAPGGTSIGNITLSGGGGGYNVTNNMGGIYTVGAMSGGGAWVSSGTNTSTLKVQGDAEFAGKVSINGQDISTVLQNINDRLSILVPDPKLLDKYEALRQAYEHYRTLEALCMDADEDRDKG